MKYTLNKLNEKTTNNFKVNDIKLDLDINKLETFNDYIILNGKDIIIEEEIKEEKITSKIGLELNKYKNINITVPKYKNIKEPVIFRYNFKDESLATNINIKYESSSNCDFIFIYKSETKDKNLNFYKENLINEKSSTGSISIVNLLNETSYNFISIENDTYENANITHNLIDLGGNIRLSNIYSEAKEYGSTNYLNNVYLGNKENIIDMNYYLKNIGKKSSNIIRVEGCLNDYSKKIFRGSIDFIKGCEKSVGDELENCIIFSDNSVSRSLPILLCAEEDVEGSHGVSSGKVSPSTLFYLNSRGYSDSDAKRLIILTKFASIINKIPNQNIQEEINTFLDNKLNNQD